jgi:hypothetical protein
MGFFLSARLNVLGNKSLSVTVFVGLRLAPRT